MFIEILWKRCKGIQRDDLELDWSLREATDIISRVVIDSNTPIC